MRWNEKEAWACREDWFSSLLGLENQELEAEKGGKGDLESGRPGSNPASVLH